MKDLADRILSLQSFSKLLGWFALVFGLVLAASITLGVLPGSQIKTVGLLFLAVVLPIQLVSAVLAFVADDPAESMAYYGSVAFLWLVLGIIGLFSSQGPLLQICIYLYTLASFGLVIFTVILIRQEVGYLEELESESIFLNTQNPMAASGSNMAPPISNAVENA